MRRKQKYSVLWTSKLKAVPSIPYYSNLITRMIVLNKKIEEDGDGRQALSKPYGTKLEVHIPQIVIPSLEVARGEGENS